MTRIAIMIGGAIAMVLAAISTTWWTVGGQEALGLRQLSVCGSGSCESYNYPESTFATLGSFAFYGAFVVAALSVVVLVARMQKMARANAAARVVAAVGVLVLGLAIAFVVTRPDALNFGDVFHKMRVFSHVLSIGWALVMYMVGGLAVIGGGVLVSVEKK
jgi:hypothetical protein